MAKKSFLSFIGDQYSKLPAVNKVDLQDKTVVIVGGNTGLGFEAAQHFARIGAGRLILACRSQEKGEVAVQRLKDATGYSKAELRLIDLSEFSSVKAFADQALKGLERFDILLLNAAIIPGEYTTTKDGWETTIQVNDLSSSLLTFLLLPRMLETAKRFNTTPRIVIVTSEVHYWTSLEDKLFGSPNAIELLSNREYCTTKIMSSRYQDSKLLNLFFARALSSRLKNQPIIVNSVNPGLCYSEIDRGFSGMAAWGFKSFKALLARTAEEGSRQLVWAATGIPDGGSLDQMRGAYINRARVEEPGDILLGEEGKKRETKLWTDLISILERVDPRAKETVLQYLS